MSTNDSALDVVEQLRGNLQSGLARTIAAEAARHARGIVDATDEEWTALAKSIVPFVCEVVVEKVTSLTEHIAKLEQRLAELETRHVLEDCGTWDQGKSYRPGSVVQDHGSRWVCLTATTSRPPGDDWQLWVKRGRDGK